MNEAEMSIERSQGQRWQRRKEARPGEIVAAALEVFAERGFAAAKLDDVAARAGVSKGTLYLYFPNKEELFKAVVREALVPNIARIEQMVAAFPGTTRELIAQIYETIGRVVTTTRIGAIPKLVLSESGNFPDVVRFYRAEVIERGFRLLGSVLQRGIDRGELRAVDVPHTVRVVIAPVLLLALWKNAIEPHTGDHLDARGYLATYLDVLLHGLAAPAKGEG
jgi:AcrR family transcriptional regulator